MVLEFVLILSERVETWAEMIFYTSAEISLELALIIGTLD